MRFLSRLVLPGLMVYGPVLAGVGVGPLAAQPRQPDATAPGPSLDASIAAAVELAEFAARHGYATEAGAMVRRVQRVVPGHACAGLLRKIAEAAADEDAETTEKLRRRHAADYSNRLGTLRASLLRLLAGKGADAKASEPRAADDPEVEQLVAIATLDPEMPGIQDRLRRRGFEMLAGFGPVASTELQAARTALAALGGGFPSVLESSAVRATWPDAFGVRTAHFAIYANVDLALVLDVARHVEAVHTMWEKLAAEAELPVTPAGRLLELRAFDSRATFDAMIEDRLLRAACAREVDTVGVYSFRARLSCAYLAGDGETARRRLIENMGHEATHQLFHQRVRGRAALPVETISFSWVEEAVCLFSETLDQTAGTAPGARCDDDLARGVRCAQTDHDPIARVRRVCGGVFLDAGDYGCAALLADVMLRGSDAAWRAAFFAALREDLDERDAGTKVLGVLGDGASFRERYEAHAHHVGQRCK